MPVLAMLVKAKSELSGFGNHPVTLGIGNQCNVSATVMPNSVGAS